VGGEKGSSWDSLRGERPLPLGCIGTRKCPPRELSQDEACIPALSVMLSACRSCERLVRSLTSTGKLDCEEVTQLCSVQLAVGRFISR
jgi:hypothetical protein